MSSPVVSSDDDGASSGGEVRANLVRTQEALLGVGSEELLSESVGSDGTKVSSGSSGEHVLHHG